MNTRPIDMVLFCPNCGLQHIDKPEGAFIPGFTADESVEWSRQHGYWDNPPHRSHLCHGCKHIWRPADVPTNGVEVVRTRSIHDSPPVTQRVRSVTVPNEPQGYPNDAQIKAAFVACFGDHYGTDKAWLDTEGSWFTEGYKAGLLAASKEHTK